ncbi:MAG: tRNA (N6-threonylcarbamoyladenosine(37)-N6)-methyltransferase TrmO [Deltaproteobacteria bacterium]
MKSDAPRPDATFTFQPIGVLRTCFAEKFGVPRQARMVAEATGVLTLRPDPRFRTALTELLAFSHVWVVYVFDRHLDEPWTPTITPPRVDAPSRVGLFASRSPHRPNPIGLSAVKLERIDLDGPGGIEIHLSGVDMLDGTPVLDIKPYLPFADHVPDASAGWAAGEIRRYAVSFTERARAQVEGPPCLARHPRFGRLVAELLEWDPRPTPQRRTMPIGAPASEGKIFGFRVLGFDVRWEIRAGAIVVLELVEA